MKKIREDSFVKLAEAAFEQAMRNVIEQAERTGTQIIVWENGAIRAKTAKQARRDLDRELNRKKR